MCAGARIGSLFSGFGGLDLAVEQVLGAETAWHAENDAAASKVLAARWPGVPNLGDVTAVDWAQVPPVDVLAGGFPCQDVSSAGKRGGLREGTRSGLWARFRDAIDVLRPQLVVIENVRGLLSACADSELGPCPRCVGGAGPHVPVLRAAGRVLGDLADLGFDAEWRTVRASAVGCCHRRERVFIAAWPTAHAGGARRGPAWHSERGDGAATDGGRRAPQPRGRGSAPAADSLTLLPTPTVTDANGGRNATAGRKPGSSHHEGTTLCDAIYEPDRWGRYAAAIARHALLVGRLAPAPTDDRGRLSPWFVEWMMGLPHGWVCDILTNRRDALARLGNGVVWQQAVYALEQTLPTIRAVA